MTKTLSGVIAAVATPIEEDGAPDLTRAVKLARHLLDNGCDGLNVLGTTGEATSFSLAERKAVMDAYKANGLPLDRLMVGTGAAAVSDAVALTRHAADVGFAGALVLPPFYYKGVPDDGLVAYIDMIVKATAQKPIPIYLYHFPAMSGLPWHVTLIRRLLESFPTRIVGLKDFLRRHGLRTIGRRGVLGLCGLSFDRSLPDRGTVGSLRGLHLGNRQPQRRSVRARLEQRRRSRTGSCRHDPQTVRWEAFGLWSKSVARSYPRGRWSGSCQTAAGTVLGG